MTATVRGRQAADSSNKNAGSILTFVDKNMQDTNHSSSEKPVYSESCQFHPQQQKSRINANAAQISLKSATSVNRCKVINNPSMKEIKIAETTAFTEDCQNKTHKHRFQRKKQQKKSERQPSGIGDHASQL